METPTGWPEGTRTSGSTGPVSSTTCPDRSGRTTASWLARVVWRLLLKKMAAAMPSARAAHVTAYAVPTRARRMRRRPALAAGLRHRVEGDRGGHPGVERLDPVDHRDRDELVAGLGDQAGEAVALGAHDDD